MILFNNKKVRNVLAFILECEMLKELFLLIALHIRTHTQTHTKIVCEIYHRDPIKLSKYIKPLLVAALKKSERNLRCRYFTASTAFRCRRRIELSLSPLQLKWQKTPITTHFFALQNDIQSGKNKRRSNGASNAKNTGLRLLVIQFPISPH